MRSGIVAVLSRKAGIVHVMAILIVQRLCISAAAILVAVYYIRLQGAAQQIIFLSSENLKYTTVMIFSLMYMLVNTLFLYYPIKRN